MKRAALILSLLLLAPRAGAQQAEIPDNAVDEDGDGWLGTSLGFSLRAEHPRSLISSQALADVVVPRMVGPEAREPYAHWFALLQSSEDGGTNVNFTALALLYVATSDSTYLDRFVARLPTSGAPTLDELYGVDLLFDHLPPATLTSIMQRAGANADVFYYNSLVESQTSDPASVSWGYHRAIGASAALVYSGAFALTDAELDKDPVACPFDALNYVRLANVQLSPDGPFWRIERRIAGDPTYNDALPGSFGGMYDNIGYDTSEESYSINLVAALDTLTGSTLAPDFLHDRYRGAYYQNLQYPYLVDHWDTDAWCRRAGTSAHQIAKIWNTQTDWITQPRADAVALTAAVYQDPRMQHYASEGTQFELCGAPYDGLEMSLLFYDDALAVDPPSSNPTATYFNGPGLVATRSDWSDDASFAVLIAGEGISRRYEDANSFLLGRKGHVVTHAGARIRFNPDNDRHHWYAIRAASKNTLKIVDPAESFDIEADGTTGPLHSGIPLVGSDNLGGMIFETPISNQDGCFTTGWDSCAQAVSRPGDAFPLGLYERANVVKFEHVDGSYTYAVGDGAAAYTRKIDLFERELVHLRPDDVVVLFDRVRSADPSFRKIWVIHTVDEPVVEGEPTEIAMGLRAYANARAVAIGNSRNVASLGLLYPPQNRTVVRGGDTVLARAPLRPGVPIAEAAITPTDIPRWVELLASGSNPNGTLQIQGDADEGAGITETVSFSDALTQDYVSAEPDEVTASSVADADQAWQPDQWAGYMVALSCGGTSEVARIESNTSTTLSGSFTACQAWQYVVFRYLANTTNHWQRITSVTSSDLDFDDLWLSVPHYFDTEDASGRLWSFAPRTDGVDDGYRKRVDLGQWTLEVQATEPTALDHFLNAFVLHDPDAPAAALAPVEGELVRGVLVADRVLTFARDAGNLGAFSFSLATNAALRALLFDVAPETTYGCERSGPTVSCAPEGAGASAVSSPMGVLELGLPEVPPFDGDAGGGAGSGDGTGDETGGCGCRFAAEHRTSSGAGWLLGLGALAMRRRSRLARHRYYVVDGWRRLRG